MVQKYPEIRFVCWEGMSFSTISTHFQTVFTELEICCTMGQLLLATDMRNSQFQEPTVSGALLAPAIPGRG